jgi:hypothetical protein
MKVKSQSENKGQVTLSMVYPSRVATGLRLDVALAACVTITIVVLNLVWFYFDHRIPTQDEAAHILSSIGFSELLARSRLWQWNWWYQCFTISSFYPPFAYFINGVFLLLLGDSRPTENIYMAVYSGLTVLSSYISTRLLNGGRLAACTAGLFLSAYPLVSCLGHSYFLDLPAVAMTLIALTAFLWWRKCTLPKFRGTIFTGLIIGAACLSKQMVPAYIAPIGMYFLLKDIVIASRWQKKPEKIGRFTWLIHTLALLATAITLSLPFVIASFSVYRDWLSFNIATFASVGVHHSFLGNLTYYLSILPLVMSVPLFCVFVLSILSFRRQEYRNLLPVMISSIAGLGLTCTSMGTDLEIRYIAPFLIGPAVLSAFFIEKLFCSTLRLWRFVGGAIVALAIGTYVSSNFCPYPIPIPPLPWASGANGALNGNPNCNGYLEWGYPFVVNTIARIDKGKPVFLNILPNHGALHVNAFRLYLWEHRDNTIYPTNSRPWSIVGDRVKFDPIEACYYMWYLRKTGDNGFPVAGQQAAKNYAKLIDFISNSGEYRLMGEMALPDGSRLMLYRRAL